MCPWSWGFTLALLFSRCMRNMRNSKQDTSQVLADLGLSDKAATIDLRQLSLLINDEIIQSQVWSAGWLWWSNEIFRIVQKFIKNGDLKEWRAKIFQHICLQIHTPHSNFITFHQILALWTDFFHFSGYYQLSNRDSGYCYFSKRGCRIYQ